MTTFGDQVRQYGGAPVSSGNGYQGWWGNDFYFVDYNNGSKNNGGKKPGDAFKYLQDAIDVASAWDVIYIRPATPDTSGGDPLKHLPESTTQWSIGSTKHGLSLIGTGFGAGKEKMNMTRLQGASGATGSVFTNYAPFTNFENLTFRRGSSTGAALLIEGQTSGGSGYSFGVSVNGCLFYKISVTGAKGAVYIESAWHTTVANSFFEQCARGIGIGVSGSNVDATSILGCTFNGIDTTIDADIYATAGSTVTEILIDRCLFAHDIPALASGAAYSKYIDFATASGLISNCAFGTETETIATNMDRSNCDVVNCWFTNTTNLNPNAD